MKLSHCSIGAAALCLTSIALAPRASSAELALPADGWTSWEVAAVDGALQALRIEEVDPVRPDVGSAVGEEPRDVPADEPAGPCDVRLHPRRAASRIASR